jgi:hypothetical protein
MDAVAIGAILSVVVSIIIFVYLLIKGIQLINKDPGE